MDLGRAEAGETLRFECRKGAQSRSFASVQHASPIMLLARHRPRVQDNHVRPDRLPPARPYAASNELSTDGERRELWAAEHQVLLR